MQCQNRDWQALLVGGKAPKIKGKKKENSLLKAQVEIYLMNLWSIVIIFTKKKKIFWMLWLIEILLFLSKEKKNIHAKYMHVCRSNVNVCSRSNRNSSKVYKSLYTHIIKIFYSNFLSCINFIKHSNSKRQFHLYDFAMLKANLFLIWWFKEFRNKLKGFE